MRHRKILITAAALSALLLLASCTDRKEENVLIDDEVIYGTETLEKSTEASEDAESEKDTHGKPSSDTEDAGEETAAPVYEPAEIPASRDADQTTLAAFTQQFNAQALFAVGDPCSYYLNGLNSSGRVIRLLHRINPETGEDLLACGKPGCTHQNDSCGAALITGDPTGLALYGGEIWVSYVDHMELNEFSDLFIAHKDVFTGETTEVGKVSAEVYSAPSAEGVLPIRPQGIFHRDWLITAGRSVYFNDSIKAAGLRFRDSTFKVAVFPMNQCSRLEAMEDAVFTGEIPVFSGDYEAHIACELSVQPFEDDLYILVSWVDLADIEAAQNDRQYIWSCEMYRWNFEKQELETLFTSDSFGCGAYYVTREGILAELIYGSNESVITLLAEAENTAESGSLYAPKKELMTLDYASEQVWFTEDRIIVTGAYETGMLRTLGGTIYSAFEPLGFDSHHPDIRVYNMTGEELLWSSKAIADPRFADASKAPQMQGVIAGYDRDALYVLWKYGLVRYPFDDFPVEYYGSPE